MIVDKRSCAGQSELTVVLKHRYSTEHFTSPLNYTSFLYLNTQGFDVDVFTKRDLCTFHQLRSW